MKLKIRRQFNMLEGTIATDGRVDMQPFAILHCQDTEFPNLCEQVKISSTYFSCLFSIPSLNILFVT